MVDQLAKDYTNKTVVFLEYDINDKSHPRVGRWWAASGITDTAPLPFIIVDSGLQVSNGSVDFYNVYKSMIDIELSRSPKGKIEAYAWRTNDKVKFKIIVANLTNDKIGLFDNFGEVFGVVYEYTDIGMTDGYVREVAYSVIGLEPGTTRTFSIETQDLIDVD